MAHRGQGFHNLKRDFVFHLQRKREIVRAKRSSFLNSTLWSVKIVIRVIRQKILGVRDFQIHYSSSSSSRIDLGTSKSKVKLFNGFPLDLRIVKIYYVHRIQRPRVVLHASIQSKVRERRNPRFLVMVISSILVMITLGLDMYIGDMMSWIHSLNLRWDRITYWLYIQSHFDQIKVIYLVSLMLSARSQDYFLVMCTKISNLDGHSEIVDRFLMFFQILQGICLIYCVIPLFLKRYISLQDI